MSSTNDEWDIDDTDYEEWLEDVDFDNRIEEKTISNDDFIIHHATEIEFRTYIITKLNEIYSYLYSNEK